MGLLVHFIVYGLGLMFCAALIILCRASWFYYFFTAKSLDEAARPSLNQVLCVLTRQCLWLKSFASTAPALGLVGTCIGIVAAFRFTGDTYNPVRHFAAQFAVSLVTIALGFAIGVIAQLVERFVRGRIEQLMLRSTYYVHPPVSRRRRSRFPLQGRFSELPAFPIMAAPSLVLLVAWFMPTHVSRGFVVKLPNSTRATMETSAETSPIMIAVAQSGNEDRGIVYLNRTPIPAGALEEMLRSRWASSKRAIYVEAEDDVRWGEVVDAIDAAQSVTRDVVLVTDPPKLEVPVHDRHHSIKR